MKHPYWRSGAVFCLVASISASLVVLSGCPGMGAGGGSSDGNSTLQPDNTAIGSIGNQKVQLGSTLKLELLLIDTPPVMFSVSPLPLPEGASFNATTGVFSFRPDASQVGDVILTFSNTESGTANSETITITVLGAPPNGKTALSGKLMDANDAAIGVTTPIVGATVTNLDTGNSTATDSEGFFLLADLPTGENHFEYSGSPAATNGDFQYAGYRATQDLIANVTNVIDRPIFLIRLDPAGQVEVDPSATTTLTNKNIGVTLTIPPNMVMDGAGELFSGMLSLSEVPKGFTPASLPETLEPALVITIQPMGLTFNQPVPVTFPNVDNLAPGSELNLWSLDHTTGEFVLSGTSRVSADGSEIVTIDGGIPAASWNLLSSLPPSGTATGATNSLCQCKKKDCDKKTGSQTTLASGELIENHTLASYRSLSQPKALRLVYNSDRADPRPVISADVEKLARAAVPLSISTSLRVAGVDQGGSVFTDTTGLSAGADATIRKVFPFDASNLVTGVYDYRLTHTSHYSLSAVSSFSFGSILVNNQSSSSFGAGWMLNGLSQIHPQKDQRLLLIEGDGSAIVFIPEPTGDNGLNLVLFDTPDSTGAVASGFKGLNPGSFTLATADSTTTVTTAVVGVVNFPDGNFDRNAFFNIGPDGAVDIASMETSPAGDDFSIQPPGGNDTFGASFTGFLFLPEGGEVIFTVDVDDTFDLIVNGASVVQFLGLTDLRSFTSPPIELPAGFVPLILNYSESSNEANVVLSASGGGLPGGVIPERFLFRVIPDLDAVPTSFVSPAGDETTIKRNDGGTFTRMRMDGTRIEFDNRGLQTAVVDRNGNTTTYGYDSSDNLVSITDPVGLSTRLDYTNTWLSSVTDPGERTTLFEHDTGGNLTTITDPDNSSRSFAYDDAHRLIAQTSKRGFITQYTYDLAGKMTQSSLPDGSTRGVIPGETIGLVDEASSTGTQENPAAVVPPQDAVSTFTDGNNNQTTFETDPFRGSNATTDALGRTTSASRDNNGNPQQITSPSGALTTTTYDNRGNLLTLTEAVGQAQQRQTFFSYEPAFNQVSSITDAAGNITAFEYDTQGNLSKTTNPLGGVSTSTYNNRGLPLTVTNGNGATVTYAYDSNSNLETVTDALGNITRFTRDAVGNITAITQGVGSPDERTRTSTYDALNRRLTSTDGTGATTQSRYDAQGIVVELENPTGEITSLTYDEQNRLSATNDPATGTRRFTYDTTGNLVTSDNGLGNLTASDYDAANQLVKSTDPLGGQLLFGYDTEGSLLSLQDPLGHTTTFEYDSLNRETRRTNVLGQSTTFIYDSRDNLISTTDPKGQTITNTYDKLSRLIRVTTPDNTVDFTYDAVGNLLTLQDNDSSLVFSYDGRNRVVTAATVDIGVQPAIVLTHTYNAVGNRTRRTDSAGGMTQFSHDAVGRLTQLITPAGDTINLAYDAAGGLTQILFPNGVTSDYQYDMRGRLVSISHAAGGTTLASFSYTRNEVGNIVSITEPTRTRQFTYNALQSITGGGTAAQPETYAYDAVGNRVTSFLSSTHVHDDADRLLKDDAFTYTYDANGNLATKSDQSDGAVTAYTWDAQNQLTRIDFSDGTHATYRYDGLGRRIEKNVKGTIKRYVYDGPNILLEYDGSNTLTARYSHGGGIDQPLSMERGGQSFFYHADHLGSIRKLTDANGVVVNSSDYDSFGRLENNIETTPNPFSFAGRERDMESGLYFFRARYYDPQTGRFISEDPIGFLGGGSNLFAYVQNNPANRNDPGGLMGGFFVPAEAVTSAEIAAFEAEVIEVSEAGGLFIPESAVTSAEIAAFEAESIGFETQILSAGEVGFETQVLTAAEVGFETEVLVASETAIVSAAEAGTATAVTAETAAGAAAGTALAIPAALVVVGTAIVVGPFAYSAHKAIEGAELSERQASLSKLRLNVFRAQKNPCLSGADKRRLRRVENLLNLAISEGGELGEKRGRRIERLLNTVRRNSAR